MIKVSKCRARRHADEGHFVPQRVKRFIQRAAKREIRMALLFV
jgi:hypothetical protein